MTDIVACILISVLLRVADGFGVHGLSAPLVAPLGSSVVLPCYVGKSLPMNDLEVEWRRTDSETLVHLYQDGESRPEVQLQDYHDRAHFFTEEIQHGNFSLRLDDLRGKDEGDYRCRAYIQQDFGETVVQIKDVERLLVSGSDGSVSAFVGEDVTLSCSVDSHITPEHIEELSWKKTHKGGDILVLLYQNNETLPDSSDEQYRGRVDFFTAEIPKGNFSLRLKSVRTEDKGVYFCQVFAGHLSANATVVLGQLGFSFLHEAVLVFCFAAGSGALLLFCYLIYSRSKNTVTISTIWKLQLSLVFFPNICLFLAFILWGFIEGYLNETVTCCTLYILRPIMLIWALPYLKYLQGNPKPWKSIFAFLELAVFTVVVYAVLFSYDWRITAHDTHITYCTKFGGPFGIVLLCILLISDTKFKTISYFVICFMSFSKFLQLINSFGLQENIIGPLVCALMLMPFLLHMPAVLNCLHRKWLILLWIITLSLLDIFIVIYGHQIMLQREKDCMEWICVALFLEVLKMMAVYTIEKQRELRRQQQTEMNQQGSNALHLCHEVMYMYGAVGVVLLSSVTLMAELILKARNGERVIVDLRVIVFPSESVFALYWLVLYLHSYWKVLTTGSTHRQRRQLGSTEESHEMEILSASISVVSQ